MTDEPEPATKDTVGTYDAILTAKPGEPLFPVQGGDPFGPATVLFWVDQARRAGLAEEDPKKSEALLRKATDAELLAWRMQAYQRGFSDDSKEQERHEVVDRYSGWEDHSDEETRTLQSQRQTRIKAAGRLHNVIALAVEIGDHLAAQRVCPEDEVKIREAVALLREAAHGCEPRRGSERS